MKHERTETAVFTKRWHTCDIDPTHVLLQDEKPLLCYVCQRELCRREICSTRQYFDDEMRYFCRDCSQYYHQYGRSLEMLEKAYEESLSALREEWKKRSLEGVTHV